MPPQHAPAMRQDATAETLEAGQKRGKTRRKSGGFTGRNLGKHGNTWENHQFGGGILDYYQENMGKTRGFWGNFDGFCLETLVIVIVSSFCQQQLGLKRQTLRNMRGWTSKHLDLRIHKWVVFAYGLGNNILLGLIARNQSELFDDHCCVILINSALADLDQERFMKLHKRLLIAKHCALLGQGPALIA
jgi:hypothetical protein